MKTLARFTLTIGAISLFSGCQGARGTLEPTMTGGPAVQTLAEPKSARWLLPQVRPSQSGPLLYAASADKNEILIYPESGYNQAPIGKISRGIKSPLGLCFDSSGNLYVVNQGTRFGEGYRAPTVTVYPSGSVRPAATYSQDLYRALYSIVDQYGDLFVSNGSFRHHSTATVVEYKPGSTSAYRVLKIAGNEADGMDFDQQGNLYVAYRPPFGSGHDSIEKFAPGSTHGQVLGMTLHQPQGLIVDSNGNIVIADTSQPTLSVVVFAPGKKRPDVRVKLPSGSDPTEIAITQDETELFVGSFRNAMVYVTPYPLSETSTWTELDQVNDVQGIALSNGQVF
jgi:hypothetical protein